MNPELSPQSMQDPSAAAPQIDYDRIIDGVMQHLTELAQDGGGEPQMDPHDPHAQMAQLMHMDPAEAMRMHGEMVRHQTLQSVAPLAHHVMVGHLTNGLPPEAAEYVGQFVAHLDPSALTPEIVDVIRRAARDYATEKTSNPPVGAEMVIGSPGGHMDPGAGGDIDGLRRLAKNLGIRNYRPEDSARKAMR